MNGNTDTALGGFNTIDEMDAICRDWQAARKCVFYPGGSCFGTDPNTVNSYQVSINALTREIDCSANQDGDQCSLDVCYIDALYIGFILGELDSVVGNFTSVPGSQESCPSGFGGLAAIGCTGTAPNVEIVREVP